MDPKLFGCCWIVPNTPLYTISQFFKKFKTHFLSWRLQLLKSSTNFSLNLVIGNQNFLFLGIVPLNLPLLGRTYLMLKRKEVLSSSANNPSCFRARKYFESLMSRTPRPTLMVSWHCVWVSSMWMTILPFFLFFVEYMPGKFDYKAFCKSVGLVSLPPIEK